MRWWYGWSQDCNGVINLSSSPPLPPPLPFPPPPSPPLLFLPLPLFSLSSPSSLSPLLFLLLLPLLLPTISPSCSLIKLQAVLEPLSTQWTSFYSLYHSFMLWLNNMDLEMANMNPNVSDMESIQAQLEKQKVGVCVSVYMCVHMCVCVRGHACVCVCTCRDKLHKLTTVDVLRTSFDLSATVCIMSLLFHSPPPLPHPGDPTASNLQGGYPGEGPGPGLQAAPGGWG